MKQGWEIKKLGEVCRFINGKAYSQHELLKEGKYPVLRVGNFYTNRDWYYSDLELPEDKYCDKGDLLYAWSASFGPRIWDGEKVIYHYHIWKIEPNEKLIRKDFLFQLLEWDTEALKTAHGTGTTMMHVGKGSIEKRLIPLPPLPEQQRIVTILDECFAAIAKAKANAEQNLKNARELFESYLQGVFENGNWEKKELRELTTVLGDGLHGTPKYTIDGEYYFINGNNLNDGKIEFKENTKRVNIDEFNKHKKNLTNRTVLVSINGTLGNIAFYNGEKIILGKSACYFNLKENVDNGFVKYVLSSPYFINYAHREATGATIKNVSLKTMREFKVPLPPLKEQQTIVRQLDALRAETQKLEGIYQQKLLNLEELKKSVLQKAFAGELKTEKERIEERKKNKE
jgi:type I restriction enzyme S subunit